MATVEGAPTPSPDPRKEMRRENTSAGEGGVWLAIRQYAPLLLTARQIQLAAELDGISLTLKQVASAYAMLRARHGYMGAGLVEANRDKYRSREEILEIVRLRVQVHNFLEEHHLPSPKTLEEWQWLSLGLRAGLVHGDFYDWFAVKCLWKRSDRQLPRSWRPDDLDKEGEFMCRRMQEEQAELAQVLGSDLAGLSSLSKSYLLDLYLARKLKSQTGDDTLMRNFSRFYVEVDPTIVKRLELARLKVIERTPNDLTHEIKLEVVHGEVKPGELD